MSDIFQKNDELASQSISFHSVFVLPGADETILFCPVLMKLYRCF